MSIVVETLSEYMNRARSGSQASLARDLGVHPNNVKRLLADSIVVDGVVYRKSKRQLGDGND